MIASIRRKVNIVALMVMPLLFFSKNTRQPFSDSFIDNQNINNLNIEIKSLQSMIKLNLSEIELKLYLKENPFKIVE